MNQDYAVRMAREAGLAEWHESIQQHGFKFADVNNLERFAALVAAHEREKFNGYDEMYEAIKEFIVACNKVSLFDNNDKYKEFNHAALLAMIAFDKANGGL